MKYKGIRLEHLKNIRREVTQWANRPLFHRVIQKVRDIKFFNHYEIHSN